MIRTVSLAAATSLAALTVTVAPAFGDAWGADQREERQVGAMLDARERALSTPRSSEDGKASPAPALRMPVVDDRFRLGSAAVPVTGAASPSAAIEWAQVAAGLAAGVLLALGLAYASRRALGRPVAH